MMLQYVLSVALLYDFKCPALERSTPCTCHGTQEWWTDRNVSVVNCSFSSLTNIPQMSKLPNYEITKLLLNNNNLTRLRLRDLRAVTRVKEIDLSRNPLGVIDNDFLSSVSPHLTRLVLVNSQIAFDGGLYFLHGLESLQELVLDKNSRFNDNTNTLPAHLLRRVSSLSKLSMKTSAIKSINPLALVGLESLLELDLSYNDLDEVPEAVQKLTNLKKLVLYGNNIATLRNNSFTKLVNLEIIDLNVNSIATIDSNAFYGVGNSLRELRLHHNDLTEIPSAALKQLEQLQSLVLSHNIIQFINHNAFDGLQKLKHLDLNNNPLIYYNEMFTGLENSLEFLTIRSTGLTSFPVDVLSPLKKLTDLDVSFNIISNPVGIGRLRLQNLWLESNGIREVSSETFQGIRHSLGVNLDNNNITSLAFALPLLPCSFAYLDLVGNPVLCDCDIKRIIYSGIVRSLAGSCTANKQRYNLSDSNFLRQLSCNTTEQTVICNDVTSTSTSPSLAPYLCVTNMVTMYYIFVIHLF